MEKTLSNSLLEAWEAAWGNGDVDPFINMVTADYVRHTKSGDEDIDAVRRQIEESRAAFPDLATEILQSVEQGDMVAIRWQSHGHHTGSFMGVPSTDREVSVYGANFCRFENGRLAEEWVVWDPRELLTAMSIFSVPHQ